MIRNSLRIIISYHDEVLNISRTILKVNLQNINYIVILILLCKIFLFLEDDDWGSRNFDSKKNMIEIQNSYMISTHHTNDVIFVSRCQFASRSSMILIVRDSDRVIFFKMKIRLAFDSIFERLRLSIIITKLCSQTQIYENSLNAS